MYPWRKSGVFFVPAFLNNFWQQWTKKQSSTAWLQIKQAGWFHTEKHIVQKYNKLMFKLYKKAPQSTACTRVRRNDFARRTYCPYPKII
jgi:hypothetical protein